MSKIKTYKLRELILMRNGKTRPSSYGEYPVYGGNGIMGYAQEYNAENVVIVGRVGAYCGNIYKSDSKCWVSDNAIQVFAKDSVDRKYLYYLMLNLDFHHYHIGGAQPLITQDIIGDFEIQLPPLEVQKRIAGILGALDDKIELNRRINANLEEQAKALFDYYFFENLSFLGETSTASLTDIADYLNGLAMQKFRPQDGESSLPVLKIKELGQGRCDAASDCCSSSIKPEYIIEDGDIIFSWSGTLLVDVWCGGRCGLNQHLFKVTSENFPKWFVYFWTKHHLAKFIRIAKDKAVTMGHIKRCDLETSCVTIPCPTTMGKLDALFSPLFSAIISSRIENRNLATLRDALLPKLMSGEINV